MVKKNVSFFGTVLRLVILNRLFNVGMSDLLKGSLEPNKNGGVCDVWSRVSR